MVRDYHGGEIKEKIAYDFSVNVHPWGMPDYVKTAILESVDSLSEYPDRFCLALREQIGQQEGLATEQILCGNGASELLMAICAAFSQGKGLKAVVGVPTFSGYERAVKAFGGTVQVVPYENIYGKGYEKEMFGNGKSIFSCENVLSDSGNKASGIENEVFPDMIFLCNPNNPTGEVVKQNALLQLIEEAEKRNTYVVVDECFLPFTKEDSLTNYVNQYSNLIVLKAFTKYYGLAGVRLGYICATQAICDRISQFLPEWNVSAVAQKAGIAALQDKEKLETWKRKTWELMELEREYLRKELEKLGLQVANSKANFLLCKCSREDLWERLLERGILVRDCRNFRGLDASYIRVCVSTREKNEILIRNIRDVIGC